MLFLVLTAIAGAITLVSGSITIYAAIKSYPGSKHRFGWGITIVTLLLTLVFLFSGLTSQQGSASGNNPAPPPSSTQQGGGVTPASTQGSPTQPPTQPSSYTANWSQGNDGWNGTSDWSVYGGGLHNSGLNNHSDDTPTITAPFQPNSDDYAVEMVFRTPTQAPYSTHCFGVTVRGSTAVDGTTSGYSINIWCNNGTTSIRAFSGSSEGSTYDTQFDPGTAWHTLRIEVKLNTVKLLIDGGSLLNVTDNAYPTGRSIGLWSDQQPLDISSFKISPL